MDKGVAAALAGKRQPEETPKAPPSTPPKKPTEALSPSRLLTKGQAMKLLEGVPRTRWRELSTYLHSKSDSWGDSVDFRKLEEWVFAAVQLAVRAQSTTPERIDQFDPRLRGITFEQATEAVDNFLSGTLSDYRVMSYDGKRLYQLVDVMEQLARSKNRV